MRFVRYEKVRLYSFGRKNRKNVFLEKATDPALLGMAKNRIIWGKLLLF
jgi:hypothetical protein